MGESQFDVVFWKVGSVWKQVPISIFVFLCNQTEAGNRVREDPQPQTHPLGQTAGVSSSHRSAARAASPPLRDDDENGHYVFELGENLTPRCNCTFYRLFSLPHVYIMSQEFLQLHIAILFSLFPIMLPRAINISSFFLFSFPFGRQNIEKAGGRLVVWNFLLPFLSTAS